MTRHLYTVSQFAARQTHRTESALRHLIYRAGTNGFGMVVRRVGSRVYLDEDQYFKWVDGLNGIGSDACADRQNACTDRMPVWGADGGQQ